MDEISSHTMLSINHGADYFKTNGEQNQSLEVKQKQMTSLRRNSPFMALFCNSKHHRFLAFQQTPTSSSFMDIFAIVRAIMLTFSDDL